MNTSMTINATAMWLLALYQVVAEEQDRRRRAAEAAHAARRHDAERHHQGVPLAGHLRVPARALDAADHRHGRLHGRRRCPKWNPINICSYHLQEAGATPVQELAYALCTAIAVLDAVRDSGQVPPRATSARSSRRISFFVNAGVRFVEEMCKMRAFVRLWDELTARALRRRRTPSTRRFRYGVQVNSLGLTEAQPENNVQRIVLEMLGVTLSRDARARAVQLPAWNEALGLPRPWDQQWSLRHAAGAGLRDRPAGVRGPVRPAPWSSRPRSPSWSPAPAPRSTGCRRWAARSPRSSPAT